MQKITQYEQMDIFSYLAQQGQVMETAEKFKRLKVGDYVGRLVLGEIEKGKITEVEGNDRFFFYRTDIGCCFSAEDRCDFEQMEKEAAEIRKQYKTIEIDKFDKFFAVQYPPRGCDGRILYAMVGIYQGMLFWKEDYTYQFLEAVKNVEKAYKDKIFKITHALNGNEINYTILDKPIPTKRLYWSKKGFYSEAKYVQVNG